MFGNENGKINFAIFDAQDEEIELFNQRHIGRKVAAKAVEGKGERVRVSGWGWGCLSKGENVKAHGKGKNVS